MALSGYTARARRLPDRPGRPDCARIAPIWRPERTCIPDGWMGSGARSFRISMATDPCPYFSLNSRAFRVSRARFGFLNVLGARACGEKSRRGAGVLRILNVRASGAPSLPAPSVLRGRAFGIFRGDISGLNVTRMSRTHVRSGRPPCVLNASAFMTPKPDVSVAKGIINFQTSHAYWKPPRRPRYCYY